MRIQYWLLPILIAIGLAITGCSLTSSERGTASSESQKKLRDSDLANLIKSKLNEDPELQSADLTVSANVDQNTVNLSGSVNSEELRTKAIQIARSAQPDLSLIDQIDVKPHELARSDYTTQSASEEREKATKRGESVGKTIDDAWIHAKIAAQLIGDFATPERSIHIDVVDGVVTLRGTVSKNEESQEAARVAKETDGVKKVINRLKVGTTEAG